VMFAENAFALLASLLLAQDASGPKRILYLSHSAGFHHESTVAARQSLETLDPSRFVVTSTNDLSYIAADRLREFDAVFFFTSGELQLDARQKADLLDFVRTRGGGFAAAHSATDTLYTWPEYGELVGAYFDGHPFAGEITVDIEDANHPTMANLGTSFNISDEIYKFRNFSRTRSHVLMTIRSSISEPDINKAEYPLDSPLAWAHTYGNGRAFYTALGHLDETWSDERFRTMLRNVLAWITREPPRIERVVKSEDGMTLTVHGTNLTTGSTMSASEAVPRLAGTWAAFANSGPPVRVLHASPSRLELRLPQTLSEPTRLIVAAGTESNSAQVDVPH
jgi:type 1 glutamine amidotransferase